MLARRPFLVGAVGFGLAFQARGLATAASAPPPTKRTSKGTALVTGGSRGIGAACCREFASRGYGVVVVYQSDARAADRVVGEIVALGGRALAVQADVGDETQVDSPSLWEGMGC